MENRDTLKNIPYTTIDKISFQLPTMIRDICLPFLKIAKSGDIAANAQSPIRKPVA